MTKTIADRCRMLRETASWMRKALIGQVIPEEEPNVEDEAQNVEWAANQLERRADEPTVPTFCECGAHRFEGVHASDCKHVNSAEHMKQCKTCGSDLSLVTIGADPTPRLECFKCLTQNRGESL